MHEIYDARNWYNTIFKYQYICRCSILLIILLIINVVVCNLFGILEYVHCLHYSTDYDTLERQWIFWLKEPLNYARHRAKRRKIKSDTKTIECDPKRKCENKTEHSSGSSVSIWQHSQSNACNLSLFVVSIWWFCCWISFLFVSIGVRECVVFSYVSLQIFLNLFSFFL